MGNISSLEFLHSNNLIFQCNIDSSSVNLQQQQMFQQIFQQQQIWHQQQQIQIASQTTQVIFIFKKFFNQAKYLKPFFLILTSPLLLSFVIFCISPCN